jgi:hypothetical protein
MDFILFISAMLKTNAFSFSSAFRKTSTIPHGVFWLRYSPTKLFLASLAGWLKSNLFGTFFQMPSAILILAKPLLQNIFPFRNTGNRLWLSKQGNSWYSKLSAVPF